MKKFILLCGFMPVALFCSEKPIQLNGKTALERLQTVEQNAAHARTMLVGEKPYYGVPLLGATDYPELKKLRACALSELLKKYARR